MMVIVSVIVCTYNREKFLPDCLESIARQTADAASFELLIINNNSTDGTDAICRRFIADHPGLNVRHFIESRQGLSFARNRGIREAQGTYLTYIDDDAVAEPDLVEKIMAFFDSHPDAWATGGRVLARFEAGPPAWINPFSDSLFVSHYDQGSRQFRYRGGGYPIGCNMSFRKSFFEKYGAFDTELGRKGKGGLGGEEKEVFGRLAHHGLPYYYDPEQVVHHQIDAFRTEKPYMTRLARGLGESYQKMYCKNGFSISCLKMFFVLLFKFGGALILAGFYLLKGRAAVSRHLIWFRWMVFKGFFQR